MSLGELQGSPARGPQPRAGMRRAPRCGGTASVSPPASRAVWILRAHQRRPQPGRGQAGARQPRVLAAARAAAQKPAQLRGHDPGAGLGTAREPAWPPPRPSLPSPARLLCCPVTLFTSRGGSGSAGLGWPTPPPSLTAGPLEAQTRGAQPGFQGPAFALALRKRLWGGGGRNQVGSAGCARQEAGGLRLLCRKAFHLPRNLEAWTCPAPVPGTPWGGPPA